MSKHFFLSASVYIFAFNICSTYCPSVSMIKQGEFNGFIAVYADNNHKISKEEVNNFIKESDRFYQAEFFEDYFFDSQSHAPFNAHCYYQNNLNIYLAKNVGNIDNTYNSWQKISGRLVCSSPDISRCHFFD